MTLALIAGAGQLPAALVAALPQKPFIAALEGFSPDGLTPDLTFRIERLYPFFRHLLDAGVTEVAFAGAVRRPRLDPAMFDQITASIVPRLMAAMGQGDDATLREILALFEEEGLKIVGTADIAPGLVPSAGVYAGQPQGFDRKDAIRARQITDALGRVDVGQGCVVQQGLCLATETIAGTDAMLAYVAGLAPDLRPDGARGRGLLFKAPKFGQDRRIDLPTLGVQSVQNAARAGLGGLAWEAGGVICLDLPAMQAAARDLGLFLLALDPGETA